MVALAKRLARYPVKGRRRSLRDVASELAAQGHVAASGKPYAAAVARMIAASLGAGGCNPQEESGKSSAHTSDVA